MAVEEINEAGGVDGKMLELVVEDSKCAAQDSITAYNKLTDVDGVKIILGTSCSGAMLGAAPLAEEDGVVLFSGLATNPDIAEAGDYIFRTAMNDLQLGIDTGNVMWADGVKNLATINESTDYAEGVRRTTVDQFQRLGGTVVASENYSSDVTDFRTQLSKLTAAEPDAIHIAAQAEFSGGTIVKQLRELGYDGPIYSEIVVVGATALEIAGEAATGLKAITAELDPANPKSAEVLANFKSRYDYISLPWYMARPMTMFTSPPSAWRRPGTTRTLTVFGTACTASRGAAPSAATTALMKRERSRGLPTASWKCSPFPTATTKTRAIRCLVRHRSIRALPLNVDGAVAGCTPQDHPAAPP